ncbi:TrbG/VirB9 family P-type conjugative transfer protein [Pusillimonas minor]|uniref:TrbG/VirB9 family P-type conjugative transfer protein n=1 Tax=Pusillimonas minor TaxID=2697024 RepID=A0A842HNA6_9BURK|nr:TrbG/VirB9 family P-type conjugative transfer protein [Pusillimonas minor]MBC2768780.1 TrbG/VirB9 family P-type conjugative transfer protein [Pusillimonas minor]
MILRTLTALCLGLAVTLTPGQSLALDNPKASPKDARIRSTEYDPANVIAVNTVAGVSTHIVLADDETYVTHAFGDALAYDFQQVGKHLLLKPIAANADTNLIVITDKRNYAFLLQNAAPGKGKETHRITLNYPESEAAISAAQAAQHQINQALDQTGVAINWQSYTMSGDQSLAPVNAWDDGAQTWLRFAPGQDLPAVYFVDADGNEVIANRHMADAQTIVMHRIAAKWHLRLGEQVLAIHNESSHQARPMPTRTISPDVERVLRTEALP